MTTAERIKRDASLLNRLVDEGPSPLTEEMASYLCGLIFEQLRGVGVALRANDPKAQESLAGAVDHLAMAGVDLAYKLSKTREGNPK